jgi:hypothetical protein
MEDYYGINRVELANFRYHTFREFRIYKKTLQQNVDDEFKNEVLEQINIMKSDNSLFAGMVRYFDAIL